MRARLHELLRLDLGAVDLHKGVMGLAAIIAFGIFVALFGDIGMVAALATLFVILADRPAPPRDRGMGVLIMTVVGSIIALMGIWAGSGHLIVSTLLTFVVVTLATLAAGFGASAATRGMLLSVWAVIAISMAGDTETAIQLAVAFAGGGLIAAAIIYLRARTRPEPTLEAAVESDAEAATRSLERIVRSPLGWFSLLRGAAAGLAMLLGATFFPEHPAWASLTVILVMKARAGETVAAGLLRTVGTVVGVLAAEAVIVVSSGETVVVVVGFMAAAFGLTALQKVNYAVFVACLTALLVLSGQLASGAGEATAIDRLLATLLGAAIAFTGIAIGRLMLGRPLMATESEPAAVGDDQTPG